MNGDPSGGVRLFNFRQGDRSEYLALYALTRIAFVTPVPRQEDFGVVDFKCVLAKKEKGLVHPKGTFNVQVKSKVAKVHLSNNEIRWVSTNLDCPLFICIVDKKCTTIKLFSCLNLWSALFLRMDPQKITLHLGKTDPSGEPYIHHPGNTGDQHRDLEGTFDVFLGQPVIHLGLTEFEEKADLVFDILNSWIRLDRFNVALMRFGRAATCEFQAWAPNQMPTLTKTQKTFNRPVNQHGLLDKICLPLESLRQSYLRIGSMERAQEIASLLSSFQSDIAKSPGSQTERLLD